MRQIPLIVTSDFDCGNAEDITEIAPDHWQIRLHGDHIYGPWYYLELQETSGRDREVQLDILDIVDLDANTTQADRPVVQIDGGPWRPLSFERARIIHTKRTALFEEPIVWFWEREEEVPENRLREMPAADVQLHLTIPANARVRVATTFPYPYGSVLSLTHWLENLPEPRHNLCRVETIGQSEENRPIPMVTLTDPSVPDDDKQIIVITARHHPSMETSGSWVAESIIEYLTSGEPEATALLAKLIVVVVPMVNVDGVFHGNPHYNVNGVDLWMDYEERQSKEVKALYATLEQLIPDFHLDFHGWICHHEGVPPYDGSYLDFENSEPWDIASYQTMADYWKKHIYGFGARDLYRSVYTSCPQGAVYWSFHTLGCTSEINPGGYTIGQLKRRGLDNFIHTVELMLRRWPGHPTHGVPNREIKQSGEVSLFAWGQNYDEIRSSRVELWAKRDEIEMRVEEGASARLVATLSAPVVTEAVAALRFPRPDGGTPVVCRNGKPLSHGELTVIEGFCFVPITLSDKATTVEMEWKELGRTGKPSATREHRMP